MGKRDNHHVSRRIWEAVEDYEAMLTAVDDEGLGVVIQLG
jgi:hypothetical protein